MTDQPRRKLILLGSVILVAGFALIPWWRNHSYLRDTYDYGLVLAANGHLELGERPYVDFTTPIQAGFLGLNWLIERAGGGTYFALTLGGAGLIVGTAVLLILMLARRWPWWAALTVGGAVVVAGASQHTILWHNSLGVSCLAAVTWAAACAPVLRRTTWPWHAIMLAGLFLGGINKLNFQLVAVAMALAWALRAGWVRQAGWGRVVATSLAIVLVGVVLPVAGEMIWTGASLSLWLANVVQLAAGSRLGILRQILSRNFLIRPIHDYYGPLLLPQVGLVGAWLSLAALAGCWPDRTASDGPARRDRWLLPLAVALAAAAAAALLATNFEIASIGLGAWLALAVSVWLGFAPSVRRTVFIGGVIVPAVILGLTAWRSAWLGQRSQFGFSTASRSEYRPAESAGPAFARLAGLRLPPDLMMSLEVVEQSMPEIDDEGGPAKRWPVFFGPGLEFLHRFFPTPWEKGQPLWGHWDTTYSPANLARLGEKLGDEGQYRAVFVTQAFDVWPSEIQARLRQNYVWGLIGPRITRWSRHDKNYLNLADCFDTLARLGGNVESQMLFLDKYPLQSRQGVEGKLLLGTSRREGSVLLRTPTHHFRGLAVLNRLPAAGDRPLYADFKATIHGSIPEEVRWSARLELPAGQQSVSMPFEADAGGRLMLLWVYQPAEKPALSFGGYRELEITHAIESTGRPRLRSDSPADVAATPELAGSFFGPVAWRPQQLILRGGGVPGPDGLQLPAGGELWLHTDNMTGEIKGEISRAEPAGGAPTVRVVWYKGGRLQLMQSGQVPAGSPFAFHVWTAEPGGWIGILLDPGSAVSPAQVRVTGATLTP